MFDLASILKRNRKQHFPPESWEIKVLQRASELNSFYTENNLHPKDIGVWNPKHLETLEISNFRSDNIYIWQTRNLQEVNFLVSYLVSKMSDKASLHEVICENGEFGVEQYWFGKRSVSRDLIDSVLEINYLIDCVGIGALAKFRVLDIGAGYGRLARNLVRVFPEITVNCADSIPISTAISEYYLKDEISKGQVEVKTLDQLKEIPIGFFDLATNVHSFSEMSLSGVELWIKLLKEKVVPRVFVVPNPKELALNTGEDFETMFKNYGYRVSSMRSKYPVEIPEKYLVYPSNYYYLELE